MATILKHWREAATLIIAAKSKNIANKYSYEILMLKRSGKSKFMPSLSVFPGGVAEDADFSPEWVDVFSSLGNDVWSQTFAHFAKVGKGPPMFSRQRDDHYSKIPSEVAFRICAIRETFEECGILLTRSSNDNKIHTLTESSSISKNYGKTGNIAISDFETWREKVDKDATQFIKMCQEFDMVPDIWSLTEWSNWLTPVSLARRSSGTDEGSKRRYDTAFFLCLLDTVPDAMHDDKETVHLQWSPPDELIKSHLESKVKLAPPQIYEICRFLNFKDMEELNEFCLTRIDKRVTRNFPVPAICDDGIFVLYPGDDLYPEDPDVYGAKEPLIIQETLREIHLKYPHHNRYVLKDKESHRDFINDVKFLCNVTQGDGHVIPVTDLSFLGMPRARF
ncbi:acyl-coenzyme A diphosphatase NUDT19-like [Mytilus californianus]|uniref:acyl-coenzyme A diphosphatase NUDT19-like n=1 Tax=Mytilus californianus TaxID=6549 RepID=UPI0022469401|nr:acyl-coenzyme A diphosphatase NUDT19-like [Mytilus californianus]